MCYVEKSTDIMLRCTKEWLTVYPQTLRGVLLMEIKSHNTENQLQLILIQKQKTKGCENCYTFQFKLSKFNQIFSKSLGFLNQCTGRNTCIKNHNGNSMMNFKCTGDPWVSDKIYLEHEEYFLRILQFIKEASTLLFESTIHSTTKNGQTGHTKIVTWLTRLKICKPGFTVTLILLAKSSLFIA